jgi:coenzyme F420-reducing hydrogenase beta subunit
MVAERPSLVSPRDMVGAGLCSGCGACAGGLGEAQARLDWGKDGQLKPVGPKPWMRRREEAFSSICPFSPRARDETRLAEDLFPGAAHVDPFVGRYRKAFVGHACESGYRERGSSGGMVSWMAAELLKRGLVDGVAHVARASDGRLFRYVLSRTPDDLHRGAQSRYYPVEMSQILREIASTPGRYAVVGIPCFIKAVQLLRAREPVFRDRIAFTLGLVCGHMKSRHLADSFAWQMGFEPDEMKEIDFRVKDVSRPANWYRARVGASDGTEREQDWWHLAGGDWGSGFFQNAACDFCDDVVAETADVSFGDAWVEPYASDGRGTNVVVVRSPEILDIASEAIASGEIKLDEVDAQFVHQTQAAGFRQRREGLAYRLALRGSRRVRPVKRVDADATIVPLRRKLVYRSRRAISRWSDRIFLAGRVLHSRRLFLSWSRLMIAIYDGVTYSRGPLRHLFALLPERSLSRSRTSPLRDEQA